MDVEHFESPLICVNHKHIIKYVTLQQQSKNIVVKIWAGKTRIGGTNVQKRSF